MNKLMMPLLAGVSLLSGCAGMNTNFDCNTVAHDRCMTMEQANLLAVSKIRNTSALKLSKKNQTAMPLPQLVATPLTPAGNQTVMRDAGPRSLWTSRRREVPPLPRADLSSIPSRLTPQAEHASDKVKYTDSSVTRPVRVAPVTSRLWIAGWIDSNDVYHHPSVLTFVITPDHWAGS